MKTLMLLCSLVTAISAAEITGKVVGVKGGAALEILSEGKVYAVKLHGIGAPARSESFGKTSRRYAADLAFMADVRFDLLATESDGSFTAKVTLADGRCLSAEMVKAGMAWWDAKTGDKDLARLESEARDAYLGLWATPEEEGDKDWRKEILVLRNAGTLLTAN